MRIRLLLLVPVLLVVGFAPAPLPRWDRPVDPLGDCRFGRAGEKLAITVPGKGHNLETRKGRLTAPCLLRDAEGDFVVQVRVRGDFQLKGLQQDGVCQGAGLILTDGEKFFHLVRVAGACTPTIGLGSGVVRASPDFPFVGRYGMSYPDGPPLTLPTYLRLERWGSDVKAAYSVDGKKWTVVEGSRPQLVLRQKLKVGVVAEASVAGIFKAEFSELKLTRMKK